MLSACEKINDRRKVVTYFSQRFAMSFMLLVAVSITLVASPPARANAAASFTQDYTSILVQDAVMKAYIRKHAAETRRRNAQMRKRGQIPYRTQSKHGRRKSNRG